MKNVKKIATALVLFVAFTGFVNAQSKVAHIDVTQLLTGMPEMKTAEAELNKLSQTYQADIESSMKELQNKVTQYRNEVDGKTKEENEKRALELQGVERNIVICYKIY
jgi:outer membrane protein